MRRLALAVLSLAVLAACQPEVGLLSEEDVAAIRNIATSYTQAVVAGDVDAVVAVYTENAVLLPPNTAMVQGRAAIRAASEADTLVTQELTLTSAEIDGRGDVAFDRGTWTWTGLAADTAEAVTETGNYLVIARKQADGSWLWAVDIWNSDTPLPQPE